MNSILQTVKSQLAEIEYEIALFSGFDGDFVVKNT